MDQIQLATPEQIEKIRLQSDLGPGSVIVAMGDDLAVVKNIVEVDPVFFDEKSTTSRRLMFIWGIENWLRLTSVWAYYFNVPPGNETWIHNVETHGAERVSREPEHRYRKVLNPIKVE